MTQETGDRELAAQLTKAFRDLDDTLKEHIRGTANTSTNQTIRFDAGGIGVWVAATCCIVMMFMVGIAGFFYIDQMRRVDKMQDYLNAIYMKAPQLKPTENKAQ